MQTKTYLYRIVYSSTNEISDLMEAEVLSHLVVKLEAMQHLGLESIPNNI